MLLILDVKVADAGVYTCLGDNGVGAPNETTAVLSVEGKILVFSTKAKLTVSTVHKSMVYLLHSLTLLTEAQSFSPPSTVTPRAIVNGGSPTLAVTEGDTLTLECEAFGRPTPEVTWLRNGTTLQVGSAGDPR